MLKDKQAANVNLIHEAFSFETQLWIVSDFCDGGSLTTLMKAYDHKLEERFIVPIAREVLIALRDIHASNVIHRDVKCANILVCEDGQVQLCDFGVSAALEAANGQNKRSTIIGTPHWMAPELVVHLGYDTKIPYSTEVDIWAFGIALIEMATGRPPNATIPVRGLGDAIKQAPPRLEGNFSDALKDLVVACLKNRPNERPTAAALLDHPYIKNSEKTHPTKDIAKLVEEFWKWQQSGGQRMSLFSNMGAISSDTLRPEGQFDDEWNFSNSDEFERRASMMFASGSSENIEMSNYERLMQEFENKKAEKGQHALGGIFDLSRKGYDPTGRRTSDLPFRNLGGSTSSDARVSTMIDLDAAMAVPEPNFNLADPPSLRRRPFPDFEDEDETLHPNRDSRIDRDSDSYRSRRTMEWKFPSMQVPSNTAKRLPKDSVTGLSVSQTARSRPKTQDWKFPTAEEMAAVSEPTSPVEPTTTGGFRRPTIKHAKTMPVPTIETSASTSGPPSPDRSSMIDLDTALVLEVPSTRPSTAGSATNSAISETTTGDPFDLEDQITITGGASRGSRRSNSSTDRGSFHRQSQSEPTLTSWNRQIFGTGVGGTIRGQPTAQGQQQGVKRESRGKKHGIQRLVQPNVEVLLPGGRKSVVKAELGRMSEDAIMRCQIGRQKWTALVGVVPHKAVKTVV